MKDTPSAPAGITGSASAPSRQSAPEPAVTARGVALVTGAGQRLGRAIALALAADGWDIGVHYRESADGAAQTVADITALGRRAVALQAGLDDASQCRQLVKRLADALGPVTGLVNSASRFDFDSIHSLTPQSFAAHLGPNLLAPLLLSQALLAQLPGRADTSSGAPAVKPALSAGPGNPDSAASHARPAVQISPAGNEAPDTSASPASAPAVIVNLLDQKLFNLNPDFLSYTLSKAALQAATTMLAQAMAPHVRVVGVAPGLTLPSYLQSDTDFAHAHRTLSPLGASSTAEDVAATVVFAMKTRSITGTTLLVDGGQHLLGLPRDASLMGQA
jgi:hypothetical protein